METKVTCHLCATPSSLYHKFSEGTYWRCPNCRTVFLDPLPTPEAMKKYVEEHYREGLYKENLKGRDLKIKTFERRLKLLDRFASKGKLLDLGCSSGYMVEVALKDGFDAWGVELSEEAVGAAAPGIKERIRVGDINQMNIGQYDVVTAFDILEHTRQPLESLKQWASLIKPGGFLMVATPNTDSWLRVLMGRRWPMLEPYQHTHLFSRRYFNTLLVQAGLRTLAVQDAVKVMSLDFLLKQLIIYFPKSVKIGLNIGKRLPVIFQCPIAFKIGEFLVIAQKQSPF